MRVGAVITLQKFEIMKSILKKVDIETSIETVDMLTECVGKFEAYNKSTKPQLNLIVSLILRLPETNGCWISYSLEHCKKSELISTIKNVLSRLKSNYTEKLKLVEAEILNEQSKLNDIKTIVVNSIINGEAKFIGEGEWIKDSVYRIYELNNRFFSVIVYDSMNKELMDSTVTEISESEISKYI